MCCYTLAAAAWGWICWESVNIRTNKKVPPVMRAAESQISGKISTSLRYLVVILCLNEVHGSKDVINLAVHKSRYFLCTSLWSNLSSCLSMAGNTWSAMHVSNADQQCCSVHRAMLELHTAVDTGCHMVK